MADPPPTDPSLSDAPSPAAPPPPGNPSVIVRDGPPTDPHLREVGTSATWTVGTAKVRQCMEHARLPVFYVASKLSTPLSISIHPSLH